MNEPTQTPGDTSPLLRPLMSWTAELLEVSRVRPEDNFLDLGGHSLQAVELIERARHTFGADLQMEHIFTMTLAEVGATATWTDTDQGQEDQ